MIKEDISDNMKKKIAMAISKAASKKKYNLVDTLEKMIAGALPMNYAIIGNILNEDSDINQQITDKQDALNDLNAKISNEEDEDKRKSLELQKKVLQAKIEELKNKANQPKETVEEEAPQQKKDFLDTDNDGYPINEKPAMSEGCMNNKFANMTNREVANYIFKHPHTKFGEKIKECDTNEVMKAVRDMAKEHKVKQLEEDGEGAVADTSTTDTSAIEMPELPWGLAKRKKKNEE